MTLPTYTTGTVGVANGGTTVTGVGTVWSGVNVREGDFFARSDGVALITGVTDTTHITITPWPGATIASGGAYTIHQNFSGRVVGVAAAEDVATLIALLGTAPSLSNNQTFAGTQTFSNTTEATGVGTTAAILIAGGVEIAKKLYVTGNVALAAALAVTGAVTLSSTLAVTGDFAVATNKFTVAAASGNTVVAGTLSVTGTAILGATTFPGSTQINGTGDLIFTTTGAHYVAATHASGSLIFLSKDGSTTRMLIDGAAVSIPGTLGVTGATALSSTLAVTGVAALGGATAIGAARLTLTGTSQTPMAWTDTAGAVGNKVFWLAYDPGNVGLTQPGLTWQNRNDSGTFVSNSGALFRNGALSLGTITYPNGGAGGLLVASTTTSTTCSTGAVVIGNGTAGGLGVGGQVSATKFASFAAPTTPAINFEGSQTTSVANGGSYALYTTTGGYLICVRDRASGEAAIYFAHIGSVALVTAAGSQWIAPTASPAAGKSSVQYSGGSYQIFNNKGSATTFSVGLLYF